MENLMMRMVLTFLVAPLCAISQGVEFRDSTLSELLESAKRENKIVMIDCYTTWCAPCRRYSETLFPTVQAGNYFNANFICCKVDMESRRGASINDLYGVAYYPTLLFINSCGEELTRVVGGSATADELIERCKKSLIPENAWPYLRMRYLIGKVDDDFYFKYMEDQGLTHEFDRALSAKFLSRPLAESMNALNWRRYKYSVPALGTPMIRYMHEHFDEVVQYADSSEVLYFFHQVLQKSLKQMLLSDRIQCDDIHLAEQLIGRYEQLRKPFTECLLQLVKVKHEKDIEALFECYPNRIAPLNEIYQKEIEKIIAILMKN